VIELTALILSRNEEANIERTLRAVGWVDRVVVVDSFSADRTQEIARGSHPNVDFLQRKFDTHANQWNFGLNQVKTEWVLTLDADYQLSSDLSEEIQRLNPALEIVGYEAEFEYRVNGQPLRASVYPPRVVLFRTKQSSYFDDGHTQRLNAGGPIAQLTGKIYHDDRKSFSHWFNAQKKYAAIEARHLLEMKNEKLESRKQKLSLQDRLRLNLVFAAPAMFFYLLFVRGLILDGLAGWIYVGQRTIAELLLSFELLRQKVRDRS
jgi:glycosyltransferase involved in cell wall biosynthesis